MAVSGSGARSADDQSVRAGELVHVPDAKVGPVDASVGVEVTRTPGGDRCEFVRIPDTKVGAVDPTVEIRITQQERASSRRAARGRACQCQPFVEILRVHLSIVVQIKRGVMGVGRNHRHQHVDVRTVQLVVVIEVARQSGIRRFQGSDVRLRTDEPHVRSSPLVIDETEWVAASISSQTSGGQRMRPRGTAVVGEWPETGVQNIGHVARRGKGRSCIADADQVVTEAHEGIANNGVHVMEQVARDDARYDFDSAGRVTPTDNAASQSRTGGVVGDRAVLDDPGACPGSQATPAAVGPVSRDR